MRRRMIPIAALPFLFLGCPPPEQEPAPPAEEPPPPAEQPDLTAERPAIVDEGPDRHLMFQPDEVAWQDGPASLEPGAEYAVLEGDPGQPGVFTMRIRMPDGYHIAPHWHPNVERVTVLSGTFMLGTGEEADRDATQRLEAGSYTSMPPETRHFGYTEGETVIQLTSVGPWEVNYVNPEDDPRRRE